MNVLCTRLVTDTAVVANELIPVGNVVHKSGCNISASGTTWSIEGAGYYDVTASITAEPTAVSTMTVNLLNNGTVIATGSATPAVAGDSVNISLVGVVYSKCGCTTNALTLQVNSAGTVTEADVAIERL